MIAKNCYSRVVVGFAKDELIFAASKGIFKNGDGMQVDVGVAALRLARRRPVKVPDGQLRRIRGLEVEGARLTAQILTGTVDPDVHGAHVMDALLQLTVTVHHRLVRLDFQTRHFDDQGRWRRNYSKRFKNLVKAEG